MYKIHTDEQLDLRQLVKPGTHVAQRPPSFCSGKASMGAALDFNGESSHRGCQILVVKPWNERWPCAVELQGARTPFSYVGGNLAGYMLRRGYASRRRVEL